MSEAKGPMASTSVSQLMANVSDPNVRISETGEKLRLIGRHGWQNQSKLDSLFCDVHSKYPHMREPVIQTWKSRHPGEDPTDHADEIEEEIRFFLQNFVIPGAEKNGILMSFYEEFLDLQYPLSTIVRISQETFDEALSENMELLDLSLADALAETIDQFKTQGVNLSNIDISGRNLQDVAGEEEELGVD